MKRTVIGSVFMVSGILITLSLIITATLYLPNITRWSDSILWFAIFGERDIDSQSLSVGEPFVIGSILCVVGLIILIIEYFKKRD